MTVYVVQEIKRLHCPSCSWSSLIKNREFDPEYKWKCKTCDTEFNDGDYRPVFDVTPARVYGELKILITSNSIGVAVQPLISILRKNLKDFNDDDYILAVGDPVAIGIVTAIATEVNLGRVRMLRWDRQTKGYIEMRINTRGTSVVDYDTERKIA